jgi:hypothetical protein
MTPLLRLHTTALILILFYKLINLKHQSFQEVTDTSGPSEQQEEDPFVPPSLRAPNG